ncbi:hypothetical protein CRUP_024992 [Coryphaenoides rupestris]|nr:hypothetical protein CRUP_024992 [Coryphaenoides rupestris]
MAPMGIRLSPLGVAISCLLGFGVIYHLYAGVITSRVAAFRRGNRVNLRDLLALSVEAAVKKVREENALEERSKGKTKEGIDEYLTLGDLRSHKKMFYLMTNTYPELKVNSEEHVNTAVEAAVWNRDIPSDIMEKIPEGKEVPADSVTVWIDPLDATQEYTENLLQYVTTMVCVAVDGKPVIGVIHKPFTGDTAWAYVGQGTNVRSRASYSSSPPKVIVSRSHAGKVKGFIQDAFGNTTTITPAGGAGYKVLALVEPLPHDTTSTYDQADVYIHVTYIKKWDICAGAALVAALGGKMTTLKGEDIDYSGSEGNNGGLVATVGLDHKAVLEKLPNWVPKKH